MRRFAILVFCMGCGATAPVASDAAPDVADAPDASDASGPFVTGVVSFSPGPCAGFGQSEMPGVVEGPPVGGGLTQGSTDVVSLGVGGSIVLSFSPNAIVDGDGPDFVVFENAFYVGGNPNDVYSEPGDVSVSDDGVTWATFSTQAGLHPVTSPPAAPTDWPACGGDAFDLAELGLAHARYVRITDASGETCTPPANTAGFDLDAIAILNAGP